MAEHAPDAAGADPAWYDNPDTKIEAATALAALGFVMAFIAMVLGSVAIHRGLRAAGGAGGPDSKYSSSSA